MLFVDEHYSPDAEAIDHQLEWERVLERDKELCRLPCDENRLCSPAVTRRWRLCNAVKHFVALRYNKTRHDRRSDRAGIDVRVLDGRQMWW